MPKRLHIELYRARSRRTERKAANNWYCALASKIRSLNSEQIVTDQALAHEVRVQRQEARRNGQKWEPQPKGVLECLLSDIEVLNFSGGGGYGRAYPAAVERAGEFGLNLYNITHVNATSVGAIVGLAVVLGYHSSQLKELLHHLPAEKFQDWNWQNVLAFPRRWGICPGKKMEDYFRKMIKIKTGLEDPTFEELYNLQKSRDPKLAKEFRIVTANISKREIAVLSRHTDPPVKVADAVASACRIPLIYTPMWMKNEAGEWEAYTDGGMVQNYPYSLGSESGVPLAKQLGFMFSHETKRVSALKTLGQFLYNLVTMVFLRTLALPRNIQERTVNIKVRGHNILNFTANLQKQRELDIFGEQGVTDFIANLIQTRLKNHPDEPEKNSEPKRDMIAYYRARSVLQSRQKQTVENEKIHTRTRLNLS